MRPDTFLKTSEVPPKLGCLSTFLPAVLRESLSGTKAKVRDAQWVLPFCASKVDPSLSSSQVTYSLVFFLEQRARFLSSVFFILGGSWDLELGP